MAVAQPFDEVDQVFLGQRGALCKQGHGHVDVVFGDLAGKFRRRVDLRSELVRQPGAVPGRADTVQFNDYFGEDCQFPVGPLIEVRNHKFAHLREQPSSRLVCAFLCKFDQGPGHPSSSSGQIGAHIVIITLPDKWRLAYYLA